MVRRAGNAAVERQPGFLGGRGYLYLSVGSNAHRIGNTRWSQGDFAQLRDQQATYPVFLCYVNDRSYWWFQNRVYWEIDDLQADEVFALLVTRERRRRQRIERAKQIVELDSWPASRREPIPGEVKQLIWTRDGGRCRVCGAQRDLQFDHVIPVVLGGATGPENLQVL